MGRFKTFADNGSLAVKDVNTLVSEIDSALHVWRTVCSASGYSSKRTDGTHLLVPNMLMLLGAGNQRIPAPIASGYWTVSSKPPHPIIMFAPQSYGGRVGRLRWRVQMLANPPAYGATLSFALYGVTSYPHVDDGVNSWPGIAGPAVSAPGTGFTVAPPAPGGDGSLIVSNTMVMPNIGNYVMGVSVNVTPAVNSDVIWRAELQFRTEELT